MDNEVFSKIVDILQHINKIDQHNRQACNVLAMLKPLLPYDTYVSILDALSSLDRAIEKSFLDILDVKEDLCDTQP